MVAVAYAVRHPERVSHLVLYGGYVRGKRQRGSAREVEQSDALLTLMRDGWGRDNPAFRQVFTSLLFPDATAEQMLWFNELQRISTSPENAARIFEVLGDIDVSELLPRVTVPTLVLHGQHDVMVPFEEGLRLAREIPGARFVALPSRNHLIHKRALLVGQTPQISDEVTQILPALHLDGEAFSGRLVELAERLLAPGAQDRVAAVARDREQPGAQMDRLVGRHEVVVGR